MDPEVFGWVASLFLTFCAMPQCYKSWKEGNAEGLSWTFLFTWFIGMLSMFIYSVLIDKIPLMLNSFITLGTILFLFIRKYLDVRFKSQLVDKTHS